MFGSQQPARSALAAAAPPQLRADRPAGGRRRSAVSGQGDPSAWSECVGPTAIPAELRRALRAVARAAGADDFLPLWTCAGVLMRRLPGDGEPSRALVIHGGWEAVTPPAIEPVDLSASFRTALRAAARSPAGAGPDPAACGVADVAFLVSRDGRSLYVESMTDSAGAPPAQCWARAFLLLLAGLAGAPDAPMAGHPLVGQPERARILHGLNRYARPEVGHRTMTGPFEEQVARTPDAAALVDEDGTTVSYRELDERANRLANVLRAGGAGADTRVAVCLERSIDLIVAIYATVKTGAGYVPLDAELPGERLAYILDDAAPVQVLTDPASRGRLPAGSRPVLDVRSGQASRRTGQAGNLVVDGTAAGLLHILYTSGTTGRPKGVAYPTDAALAHLSWMQSRYPFRPGDCALFKTSPGFDVSIWEIFWPLYHGARLLICRPGGHRDPQHLAGLVERHAVSTIFLPPTVMAPFLDKLSPGRARALRWALCGGEPVTARVRDTFYATLPAATLVNCYGPTEAGNVTDMILPPDPGAPVPLGRPAGNFRLTLLDHNLELVPIGMPGEAYIGGETGLAQAYWRAPGRTAERFVADPFGEPGARMYRTGDLCRYRDDGVLEHLGRIDRQIKIRGLRIEPGEIESVLAGHPDVAGCAVVAHGSPTRLLAFVVPAGRQPVDHLDVTGILTHAASSLPRHMRPDQIVPVARVPATVNGKVDREALIQAWQELTERDREFVPPADELEAQLAELYGRVLNTTPVSMRDTFTRLGGDSLLAFKLLEECLATLDARLDVPVLLTGTVRDVAASIRAARLARPDPGPGS